MHLPSSNTLEIMAKRMLGLLQPLPCELGRGGGCGARIENDFSKFFALRFKLFSLRKKYGKTPETIGENAVRKTAPLNKYGPSNLYFSIAMA